MSQSAEASESASPTETTAAVGTIDSDFRGELKVILANFSKQPWLLRVGDRIAQLVFAKVERIHWDLTEELDNTDRGIKGCGSTGV